MKLSGAHKIGEERFVEALRAYKIADRTVRGAKELEPHQSVVLRHHKATLYNLVALCY
jgi:hypothetical protein